MIKQVAATLFQQLGGTKFQIMTGARGMVALDNGLQFTLDRFAINGLWANKVRITLEPSDTYTVEFWYIRRADAVLTKSVEDVYEDRLREVFTQYTGLLTSVSGR